MPSRVCKESAELQELAANATCADCGQSQPRWASVSLGVFVCIECSGIHRQLGVHISRIRSVDFDRWDAASVQVYHLSYLMYDYSVAGANDLWDGIGRGWHA